MTEEQAKKKWCPMARFALEKSADQMLAMTSVNAWKIGDEPEKRTTCIGSGCMMWHWSNHGSLVEAIEGGGRDMGFDGNTDGYCGLA